MNALEFRPDSSRFAPVRRLQTAGAHRGVHRDSVNEAIAWLNDVIQENDENYCTEQFALCQVFWLSRICLGYGSHIIVQEE